MYGSGDNITGPVFIRMEERMVSGSPCLGLYRCNEQEDDDGE
jgi:hypothetical protein